MQAHYEMPVLDKGAFTCPVCQAYSAMNWGWLNNNHTGQTTPLKIAICHRCKKFSVWHTEIKNIIYPAILTPPPPNEDIPEECRKDYLEAREISNISPRGAAALLRLCIQKLCGELGEKGKSINEDIASLVKKGLPERVQQALDIVRVVGNNAVHPGEISVDDQPETVMALFGLVNMIIDNQITQPKQVNSLFASLPEKAKEAVTKRDSNQ